MKGVRQVADATCLACGCLCDDIMLDVAGDQILKAERSCPIGERWFLANRSADLPACQIDGVTASLEAGYARAAEILAGARHPLVFGLAGATCEAQRVAVSLAERLGGCIDVGSDAVAALAMASHSIGMVTATLGEVRHRADLVIFWGVDPATTHPRHFERYSLEPRGEFVPGGRADRTCVVIDHRQTVTAAEADLFLQIAIGTDADALATIQALVDGKDLDAAAVERETGVALAAWKSLVDRLVAARYGALFYDPARKFPDHLRTLQQMLTLVRDMNHRTRLVCLPMGAAGNSTGATQVIAWQTGYASAVDFAEGFPRHDWGEFQAAGALLSGRSDAALIVSADPEQILPKAARERLAAMPRVVLHPTNVAAPDGVAVTFAVATPGIHVGGTVFRCDGVPLPLRAAVASPYPSAEAVLEAIERVVVGW